MKPLSAPGRWLSGHELGVPRKRIEPGHIFMVARDGGIPLPDVCQDKQTLRCPFHHDRHASAFLSVNNVFYCSVCTPEGGWTAKRFAQELGVPWNGRWQGPTGFRASARKQEPPSPTFTAGQAQAVWFKARSRARAGPPHEGVEPVRAYLAKRWLAGALERGLAGIIDDATVLPGAIGWWPNGGYGLIAPLFDPSGLLVNVQARAIKEAERKVLFPPGSRAKGAVFANGPGRQVLSGDWDGMRAVIVGEGLTDYLALSICSSQPVLAIPGTGAAETSFGPWVRGMNVCLALDMDDAGEDACKVASRAAYQCGARRVGRISWPDECTDACDALSVLGSMDLGHLLARCCSDAE